LPVGDIYEESSAGIGKLRKRSKSVLVPPLDTHEIVYELNGGDRVIPVLELSSLFPPSTGRRKRG
jgi:hypothetical protein